MDPSISPPKNTSSQGLLTALALRVVFWCLLVVPLVLCLGYLSVRYLLWTDTEWLRGVVTEQVQSRLGLGSSIGQLRTTWKAGNPAIEMRHIAVLAPDNSQPVLSVAEADLVLSWKSLLAGDLRWRSFSANGIDVQVERRNNGIWSFGGIDVDTAKPTQLEPLAWLLKQGGLELNEVQIRYADHSRGVQKNSPRATAHIKRFDLNASGAGHRANLTLLNARSQRGQAPQTMFEQTDVNVQWTATSKPQEWKRWKGALAVDSSMLDLGELSHWAKSFHAYQLAPLQGQGSVQWRGDFAQGAWQAASLKTIAGSIGIGRLLARGVDIDVSASAVAKEGLGSWRLDFKSASTKQPNLKLLRPASMVLDSQLALQSLDVEFEKVDLAELSSWIRQGVVDPSLAIPPALLSLWRDRLTRLEPSGDLLKPSLRWTKQSYAVSAGLEKVALKAQENREAILGVPGVSGLSGQVQADQLGGRFDLLLDHGKLEIPRLFEQAVVPLTRASARGGWVYQANNQIKVDLGELQFDNNDAAGSATGSYQSGGKSIGVLNLDGRLHRSAADRVHAYLPLVLPANVRTWVKESIKPDSTKGMQVRDTEFRVRGDLADFPFVEPSSGEFFIKTQLSNASLAYAPGWPEVSDITGKLTFERDGMLLKATHGKIHGVVLSDVEASFKSFSSGTLHLNGTGLGPAQDMIRFLNETPLGPKLDNFTAQTKVSGDARLELALQLPLAQLERGEFNGAVTLANNQIKLDNSLPWFSDASGRLEFSNKGYGLKDIRTNMAGSPVVVNAQSQADGSLHIGADGRMSAYAIRRLVDNVLTEQLTGEAQYRADIRVDKGKVSVNLKSDLRGLQSDLPAPLGKSLDSAMPLVFKLEPTRFDPQGLPVGDKINIALGEKMQLAFERERLSPSATVATESSSGKNLGWTIARGALGYGLDPALPDSGMSAALAIDYLDIDAWKAALTRLHAPLRISSGPEVGEDAVDLVAGFDLMPHRFAFSANTVLLGKREFSSVVAGASRERANWQVTLSSKEVDGHVQWLDATPSNRNASVIGRFARLDIPRARRAELESLLEQKESRLPEIDIEAQEFTLNGIAMGKLSLKASNRVQQEHAFWNIQQLDIDNSDFSLSAKGQWDLYSDESHGRSAVDFQMRLHDGGAALGRLGVKDAVRGADGNFSGQLAWRGSPLSFDPRSLSGVVKVDINKGQFLKVEPGAAKLIGVLNMQALPRRLLFDFRDVTEDGFAFDGVDGQVVIEAGVAKTERITMRGIQAQVLISGQASLVNETQQLSLEVRPEVNAGGASLAYAALVNPAIGLGTFLAQWLFRRPLQNLFSFHVDLSGTWAKPIVVTRERARYQVPNTSGEPREDR